MGKKFWTLFVCTIVVLPGYALSAEGIDVSVTRDVGKQDVILLAADASAATPVREADPTVDTKDLENLVKALKGLKFSGLWYLSYQNGETGNTRGGSSVSQFVAKRGYLTVEKEITPWLSGRLTTDVTTVNDPTSNLDGSLAIRIKYLYAQFLAPTYGPLTKPNVEFGVVHTPWLDFEEHINYYRLQDPMFTERNGVFNSADQGVTLAMLLGGTISADYQERVNPAYPGRYGSVQLGLYNGGGYAAAEKNHNKVFEGRLTVRPLPEFLPGLQLSYFGLIGKGNVAVQPPDWNAQIAFVSYEHPLFVLTGQYYWGVGNQRGSDERRKDGYSFFGELKPVDKISFVGRFDRFDPNTRASHNENSRYIGGVAYHIDKLHRNMLLLDYDMVSYEQRGFSNDRRIQFTWQVVF